MSLRFLTPLNAGVWTPASESGQVYWFRADTLSESGGVVTSWTDRGPNGYNATPHGSPTVVSSVINGQPVVRLSSASSQYFDYAGSTVLRTKDQPFTLFIVAKAPSSLPSNTIHCLLTFAQASDGWFGFLVGNFSGYTPLYWGGGTGGGSSGSVGVSGFDYYSAFFAETLLYNGGGSFASTGNYSAFKNGTAETLTTSGNVATSSATSYIGRWTTGTDLYPDVDIAEIILWDHELDSTARANLNTYRNTRYGI